MARKKGDPKRGLGYGNMEAVISGFVVAMKTGSQAASQASEQVIQVSGQADSWVVDDHFAGVEHLF